MGFAQMPFVLVWVNASVAAAAFIKDPTATHSPSAGHETEL